MTIEIGVLFTVISLVLAVLGYQLNKQKQQLEQQKEVRTESRQDAEKDAEIRTQLGYIGKGVDDIRVDLRAQDRQMIVYGERLTRVEESSKQAHKRLDNLEGGN